MVATRRTRRAAAAEADALREHLGELSSFNRREANQQTPEKPADDSAPITRGRSARGKENAGAGAGARKTATGRRKKAVFDAVEDARVEGDFAIQDVEDPFVDEEVRVSPPRPKTRRGRRDVAVEDEEEVLETVQTVFKESEQDPECEAQSESGEVLVPRNASAEAVPAVMELEREDPDKMGPVLESKQAGDVNEKVLVDEARPTDVNNNEEALLRQLQEEINACSDGHQLNEDITQDIFEDCPESPLILADDSFETLEALIEPTEVLWDGLSSEREGPPEDVVEMEVEVNGEERTPKAEHIALGNAHHDLAPSTTTGSFKAAIEPELALNRPVTPVKDRQTSTPTQTATSKRPKTPRFDPEVHGAMNTMKKGDFKIVCKSPGKKSFIPNAPDSKPALAKRPLAMKKLTLQKPKAVGKPTTSIRPASSLSTTRPLSKPTAKPIPRPTSLNPPKPASRSTKPPTIPNFELPGEAFARKQREARLARQRTEATAEQKVTLEFKARPVPAAVRAQAIKPPAAVTIKPKPVQPKHVDAGSKKVIINGLAIAADVGAPTIPPPPTAAPAKPSTVYTSPPRPYAVHKQRESGKVIINGIAQERDVGAPTIAPLERSDVSPETQRRMQAAEVLRARREAAEVGREKVKLWAVERREREAAERRRVLEEARRGRA